MIKENTHQVKKELIEVLINQEQNRVNQTNKNKMKNKSRIQIDQVILFQKIKEANQVFNLNIQNLSQNNKLTLTKDQPQRNK